MRLLSLPQEVQWLIEQGNLSAGHGRALLSLPAPEEQIQFAGEIMEKGYSVRETEERIRQRLQGPGPACPGAPRPPPRSASTIRRRNVSSPRGWGGG